MAGVDLTSFAVIGDFCEIVAGIYSGAAEPSANGTSPSASPTHSDPRPASRSVFLELANGLRAFDDDQLVDAQASFDGIVESAQTWGLTFMAGYGGLFAADVADALAPSHRRRGSRPRRCSARRGGVGRPPAAGEDRSAPRRCWPSTVSVTPIPSAWFTTPSPSRSRMATASTSSPAWRSSPALGGVPCGWTPAAVGITRRLRDTFDRASAANRSARARGRRDRGRGALGDEFSAAEEEGYTLGVDDGIAYLQRARAKRRTVSHGWASLTATELRVVVALLAEGLTNVQIATRSLMSPETVKSMSPTSSPSSASPTAPTSLRSQRAASA